MRLARDGVEEALAAGISLGKRRRAFHQFS